MSRIFINQTYLRIILCVGVNISGALSTRIYYKKPVSGTIGYVDASTGDPPEEGILYYDLLPVDSTHPPLLNEVGRWQFWAYVQFADGREARGSTVSRMINDNEDKC